MIAPQNIKAYKTNLRKEIKHKRNLFTNEQKEEIFTKISSNIYSLKSYNNADTILIFVSFDGEIDTHRIINHSLEAGKRVAVPRCVEGTREMQFYYINSFDDLKSANYGILEPEPNKEMLYTENSENHLMIAPCLSCDESGYRLGYGGGYYDRYLENFKGKTAVVVFEELILKKFWRGKFDIPCNIIVSEQKIRFTPKRRT